MAKPPPVNAAGIASFLFPSPSALSSTLLLSHFPFPSIHSFPPSPPLSLPSHTLSTFLHVLSGRYDVTMHPGLLQLHGKSHDFKIPYKTIAKLYALPHPDKRSIFFVVCAPRPLPPERDAMAGAHVYRLDRTPASIPVSSDLSFPSVMAPLYTLQFTVGVCLPYHRFSLPWSRPSDRDRHATPTSSCIFPTTRRFPSRSSYQSLEAPRSLGPGAVRVRVRVHLGAARWGMHANKGVHVNGGEALLFCYGSFGLIRTFLNVARDNISSQGGAEGTLGDFCLPPHLSSGQPILDLTAPARFFPGPTTRSTACNLQCAARLST